MPYLKYLNKKDVACWLREIHKRICDNHLGARTITYKLLKLGYYQPTMKKYAVIFIQSVKNV